MSLSLLGSVSGLALLDSLNPFTIAAQAYLLGTSRPMPRSLAFLAGTYVTYVLGGVVLLAGVAALMTWAALFLPSWTLGVAELVLAVALVIFGVEAAQRAKAGSPIVPPADLGIGAALALAVVSSAADLPSALPLFAATSLIAVEGLPWSADLALLAGYGLLYCAPLIALVLVRAVLRARSDAAFQAIRDALDWAFAKLLPPAMFLCSVALCVDGVRRLTSL